MNRVARIVISALLIVADGIGIKVFLDPIHGWRIALGAVFCIGFSCALGVVLGRWCGRAAR